MLQYVLTFELSCMHFVVNHWFLFCCQQLLCDRELSGVCLSCSLDSSLHCAHHQEQREIYETSANLL